MSVFDVLEPDEHSRIRRRKQPSWIEPMKATLVHDRFSDPDWLFEPKLDGVRCLVFRRASETMLMSRNRKHMEHSYPELASALDDQIAVDAVLDGEIVAFEGDIPSFSRLQRRMHVLHPPAALVRDTPAFLYLFDVVHLDGYDTTRVPLRARKRLLLEAFDVASPVAVVEHRDAEGEAYYEEMCATPGWEGVIAKRAESEYTSTRSKDWLKFKCTNEQEFVIGGYTDPQGAREHLGALLVGYYEDGRLRYAGKVGTGFDRTTLTRLASALGSRRRKTPPFADPPRVKAKWVTPDLVAQVGFGEWTGDGRLRHPRFLGLRRDKAASEVVRERPA